MNIHITSVTVNTKKLTPTLSFQLACEYYFPLEIIVGVSGRLLAQDGAIIADLVEHVTERDVHMRLKPMEKSGRDKIYSRKSDGLYSVTVEAAIPPQAVTHLETLRGKNPRQAMECLLSLSVKMLHAPNSIEEALVPHSHDPLVSFNIQKVEIQKIIEQSEWVRDFAKSLSIGDFLLVEFNLPDSDQIPNYWKDLFGRMAQSTRQMREAIQKQEWSTAMHRARMFFELLKFKKSNGDPGEFKERLKQLFLSQQYSDEGFNALLDSVWHAFDYASKFIHFKDTSGGLQPDPIARREDALWMYASASSLLNLVKAKITGHTN